MVSPVGPSVFGGPPPWIFLPFVLVGGVFVFIIAKMIFQAISNAQQPVLERQARIIGRRQRTSVSGGMNNTPASSTNHYYVTFEFEDGSREEFSVRGTDFGLLAEGDQGILTSQGTWFKGFDRTIR